MQAKKRSVRAVPAAPADGFARRAMYVSVLVSVLLAGAANAATNVSDITALMKSGKQAEAVAMLESALKKDPQDPQLRFAKGVVLIEQKRTQEAIAVFLKLSEEFPNLPEPYNNLAVLYSQDNQYDKARAALNMAIKTNASYATAYENLGDVHARMAAQAYDKALNLNSDNGVKSKLAILHTLGIPPVTKVAAIAPPAAAPVTSSVPAPTVTASTAPAAPAAPASPADLEKRPAADKNAVAAAIAAARQAAAGLAAAAAPAPAPAPTAPVVTRTAPPAAAPVVVAAAPATAPAAVPAPAKAPAAKPAPVVSDQDNILAAISTWSKAWAGKDMEGYLSAYDAGYKGTTKSRAAWVAERKMRIMGKNSIQITVESPTVDLNGDTATASFRQIYVGGSVHSDGIKTLTLKKIGGKWQITNETSTS